MRKGFQNFLAIASKRNFRTSISHLNKHPILFSKKQHFQSKFLIRKFNTNFQDSQQRYRFSTEKEDGNKKVYSKLVCRDKKKKNKKLLEFLGLLGLGIAFFYQLNKESEKPLSIETKEKITGKIGKKKKGKKETETLKKMIDNQKSIIDLLSLFSFYLKKEEKMLVTQTKKKINIMKSKIFFGEEVDKSELEETFSQILKLSNTLEKVVIESISKNKKEFSHLSEELPAIINQLENFKDFKEKEREEFLNEIEKQLNNKKKSIIKNFEQIAKQDWDISKEKTKQNYQKTRKDYLESKIESEFEKEFISIVKEKKGLLDTSILSFPLVKIDKEIEVPGFLNRFFKAFSSAAFAGVAGSFLSFMVIENSDFFIDELQNNEVNVNEIFKITGIPSNYTDYSSYLSIFAGSLIGICSLAFGNWNSMEKRDNTICKEIKSWLKTENNSVEEIKEVLTKMYDSNFQDSFQKEVNKKKEFQKRKERTSRKIAKSEKDFEQIKKLCRRIKKTEFEEYRDLKK